MPARYLPANPSLEQLRKQAKALRTEVRSGDPAAVEAARALHPRWAASGADPIEFTLADAQLVLARRYGFASWRRLREHLAVIARYSRAPHREPAGAAAGKVASRVEEFLRLACLTYGIGVGADDARRPARARALLSADPELAGADVYTAAAVGDVAAARRLLAADPALADREGGPHRWPPLLYLAYSRVDSADPDHSPVEVARLLLAHGADPNTGYLSDGEPPPYTALAGAFGGGLDPANQPAHRHGRRLARLLLDAGADPNDARVLASRGGYPEDNSHLELLLRYGLGRGDGGPWRVRLGPAQPPPARLLQDELLRAAAMGMAARVRLLLSQQVDVHAIGTGPHRRHRGRTALELAVLNGHADVAELLLAAGAAPPRLEPVEELAGACLRGDRATADRLLAADPDLAGRLVAREPALLARAAGLGRPAAVRLLAAVGYPVNVAGWPAPLHLAAGEGHLAAVEALLALGADPTARAVDFKPGDPAVSIVDPTPLGWARHHGRREVAGFLSALH